MKFEPFLAPIALAAFLATSGAAFAVPTAYTTQASFLAAISSPGVDTFDDLDPTGTVLAPLNRSAGSYTYTASVAPDTYFFPASDSNADIWLGPYFRTDTITFSNFSADVRGVGAFFFGTDDFGALTSATFLTVTATDASGTITQLLLNPSTNSFLGFVSTSALVSLTVAVGVPGTGEAGVYPAINDLTLGAAVAVAAVPEPETYALMLGGIGLLGWISRRRKA